jgi:hypothetical protein
MLRQFLVRCGRQCVQYRASCIGDDGRRPGGAPGCHAASGASYAAPDLRHGRDRLRSDGGARRGSDRLGADLGHRRCCADRSRSRLFRLRELHHARLRRRDAGSALAAAWADDGDERRAAVRLVDRGHFRGAAEDHGIGSARPAIRREVRPRWWAKDAASPTGWCRRGRRATRGVGTRACRASAPPIAAPLRSACPWRGCTRPQPLKPLSPRGRDRGRDRQALAALSRVPRRGRRRPRPPYPPRDARNSCGVLPVCLRKKRAKCDGSEKARS